MFGSVRLNEDNPLRCKPLSTWVISYRSGNELNRVRRSGALARQPDSSVNLGSFSRLMQRLLRKRAIVAPAGTRWSRMACTSKYP